MKKSGLAGIERLFAVGVSQSLRQDWKIRNSYGKTFALNLLTKYEDVMFEKEIAKQRV